MTWAWWRSAPASSCWRSLISALAQRSQARVTGRLAARVMNDLRVKVFTQLQRLGLDYYTEEKAGVIMTRMTSDIENLQQLLQDGLAQLVGQALTMVVITVILFTHERRADADHACPRDPDPDARDDLVHARLAARLRACA